MLNRSALLVILTLSAIAFGGCGSTGGQASNTGSTSQALSDTKASSDHAKKTDDQENNPNAEDVSDPDYFRVLSKVKVEANKYWEDRFTKCGSTQSGADRWISYDPAKKSYLEVIKLRKFTSFPYRLNNADKFNKEWRAISVVQGEVWRECAEGPCGKYAGGVIGLSDLLTPMAMLFYKEETFNQGLITLNIHVEKGRYSSNDPVSRLYAPSCDEVKRHSIWKEY